MRKKDYRILMLLGVAVLLYRAYAACNLANGSQLVSITWQACDGNTELDTCPKNGGKRIFSGRIFPEDESDERVKVKARAVISPVASGQVVYFKFFDVDDPSSNLNDLDSNGGAGGDNFGSISYPQTSAATDAAGIATVEFIVSRQPGDNYKVFAACNQEELNALTQLNVDEGNIPDDIVESEMLTSWRKLWLEFDSMEAVHITGEQRNFDIHTIDEIVWSDLETFSRIELEGGNYISDDEDRFVGGMAVIDGQSYEIFGNSDTFFHDTVWVYDTVPLIAEGEAITLYDDDYDSVTHTLKRTLPYALSGGSYITTWFEDAYILPIDVSTGHIDNDITFNRNIGFLENGIWGGSLSSTADFWAVHLVAGWQAEKGRDGDPDAESATLGWASSFSNNGTIFVEPVRELDPVTREGEAYVIIHEIGHMGGADHGDGGIMKANISDGWGLPFTHKSIKKFRQGARF